MAAMDARARAQQAFAQRDWQAAYDAFAEVGELTADDHDARAESAHWLGLPNVAIDSYGEAYRLHAEAGAPPRQPRRTGARSTSASASASASVPVEPALATGAGTRLVPRVGRTAH